MKRITKLNNRQEKDNSSITTTLLSDMENDSTKKPFFNYFDYIFVSCLFIYLFVKLLLGFDVISWQLSSLGRLSLIKLLPYYDWTYLKNEHCLINGFFVKNKIITNELDCNMCEDLYNIDVYESLEEDILEERYINLDIPVIITKHNEDWPKNSNFMTDLKNEYHFSNSYPCNLATNMFKGISNLHTILMKQKYFDNFFIQFQNCELEAMRSLRRYIFTPDFLPSIYSPTIYNWLIWNQNYNTTNYKQIELIEKVTLIGQVFGSTYIRLIPRTNCEDICRILGFTLRSGESLIFTSLWDLEYKPNPNGENMAVIMEYKD